jgi:hypothetical protein
MIYMTPDGHFRSTVPVAGSRPVMDNNTSKSCLVNKLISSSGTKKPHIPGSILSCPAAGGLRSVVMRFLDIEVRH